jgi:hypothetical protein
LKTSKISDLSFLKVRATERQKSSERLSGIVRRPSATTPTGPDQWRSRITARPARCNVVTHRRTAARYPETFPKAGSPSSPSQQSWFKGTRTVLMCHLAINAAPAASAPTLLAVAEFEYP